MSMVNQQPTWPDVQRLTRLQDLGLTDAEIGHYYRVSNRAGRTKLEHPESFSANPGSDFTPRFWQRASTTLALIRCGYVTYEALRQGLGYRSRSSAYVLVKKMMGLGWVTQTSDKAATLRLTSQGQQMGGLIIPMKRHPDGRLAVCHGPHPRPHGQTSRKGSSGNGRPEC